MKNNEEVTFSNEMGLSRDEMNQIVGGTTFTDGCGSNPSDSEFCALCCLICTDSTVSINNCPNGCKSKSVNPPAPGVIAG